jgi:hypothetical protein
MNRKHLIWEQLDDEWINDPKPNGCTDRAKVPGGWLVSVWAGDERQPDGGGLTLLPDPNYLWDVQLKPTS